MADNLILITGGAGFIGSHTAVEVLNAGYKVVIIDNLCNASEGNHAYHYFWERHKVKAKRSRQKVTFLASQSM